MGAARAIRRALRAGFSPVAFRYAELHYDVRLLDVSRRADRYAAEQVAHHRRRITLSNAKIFPCILFAHFLLCSLFLGGTRKAVGRCISMHNIQGPLKVRERLNIRKTVDFKKECFRQEFLDLDNLFNGSPRDFDDVGKVKMIIFWSTVEAVPEQNHDCIKVTRKW